MRSLRIIILLSAVGLFSLTAKAQDKTLLQTEVMAKRLGLDAKQKAEVDKLFKTIKSEREALQVKMKAFKEEMKRDQFVKRQGQEASLKSILTEEQFAKVQAHRKKAQMAKGQRGFGQMRGKQMAQKRKMAAMYKKENAFSGQRMQRGQQGQQRQMQFRKMFENDPEMKKKFKEFLEQEKKKSGGGN